MFSFGRLLSALPIATNVEGRFPRPGSADYHKVVARNITILRANGFYWSKMLAQHGDSLWRGETFYPQGRREELDDRMAPILLRRTEMEAPQWEGTKMTYAHRSHISFGIRECLLEPLTLRVRSRILHTKRLPEPPSMSGSVIARVDSGGWRRIVQETLRD
jgi:hypothetical protein